MTVHQNLHLRDASETPLHHQIYLQVRELIRLRHYLVGDKMPAETQLCQIYGVSRATIRRAMQRLRSEGYVQQTPGRGTIVSGLGDLGNVHELLQNVEAVMSSTTGQVLEFGHAPAHQAVAEAVRVPPGTSMLRVVHLRMRGDVPIGLLWSWVPAAFAHLIKRREAHRIAAIGMFKRAGLAIGRVEQIITAMIADSETATSMHVPAGFPLLRLERTLHDDQGSPLEHLTAFYRADQYAVRMTLSPGLKGGEHWSMHKFE